MRIRPRAQTPAEASAFFAPESRGAPTPVLGACVTRFARGKTDGEGLEQFPRDIDERHHRREQEVKVPARQQHHPRMSLGVPGGAWANVGHGISSRCEQIHAKCRWQPEAPRRSPGEPTARKPDRRPTRC